MTQTPAQTQAMITEALEKAYIQGGVECLTNVLPALQNMEAMVAASIQSIQDFITANKDKTVDTVTAKITDPASNDDTTI
jgi:hypothetical protein